MQGTTYVTEDFIPSQTNNTFLFPGSTGLTGINFSADGFHFQGTLIDCAFLCSPNNPSMIIIPFGEEK